MSARTLASLGLFGLAIAAMPLGCTTEAYCFTHCDDTVIASNNGGSGSIASGGHGGALTLGQGGKSMALGGTGGGTGGQPPACKADLQTDPTNCGECGNKCEIAGAFPKCEKGDCVIDKCAPGREDLNKDPKDGCEYACTPTVPDTEICDGKDNNCNGQVDEGIDTTKDPENCGSCGNSCTKSLPNAKASACVMSMCVITKCADGFGDPDKIPTDGCEYKCPVFPTTAETCNGKDDDCDGVVDNGNPGGGQACTETCPGGVCQGECTAGTRQCAGDGTFLCIPGKGPTLETCNQKDDDCNGVVDDGFDVMTDPQNCGSCGNSCAYTNAIGACNSGKCKLLECKPGFADNDKKDTNGCEYACPTKVPGTEVCDGIDNDCNGLVDGMDPGLIVPTGVCNNKAGTPCAGAMLVCAGALGFRCSYGPDVEVDASGNIVGTELVCDGKDGNCDGQVDETFPLVQKPCDDGKIGACASTGTYQCNAKKDGIVCDITHVGSPSSKEICNGVDDDCNGSIDDGLDDTAYAMVAVPSAPTVLIDQYEASHPDATTTKEGTQTALACGRPDVLPWTAVSFASATAACAARGPKYRLCTATELETACGDAAGSAYPYGATYQPTSCNGADDGAPSKLLPTGSLAMCVTPSQVFDLSGNATEWSSTATGTTQTMPNFTIYQLQGGSYLSPSLGLSCVIPLAPRAAENAILADVGFRCCRDM